MNIESIQIEQLELRKLLGAASGDAALLESGVHPHSTKAAAAATNIFLVIFTIFSP